MIFLPLYIDPGTGSMLFSLFIGIATAAVFGLKALIVKLKFIASGGKAESKESENNIPYVIFSDHKRYWTTFKSVCDEFEKRGIDVVYYTASEDDPVLSAEYKHIKAEYLGSGNKPYAKLNFLHADVVLATTPGLNVYQWKRSKYVKKYVHIPHSVDDLASYRMFGLDYYDTVLTSGNNQMEFIRKIESLRPSIARKEILNAGSTYLDAMKIKVADKLRTEENEQKIVLVAPSWGASGILSRYGEKLLNELCKTEYKIVVRPHPQTFVSEKTMLESLMQKFPDIEWNSDNDNFDILNKSDLLITDFSSIIFDYTLIFNKPLIYADTSFDTLPYDADWIDEPIWPLRVLPELGVQLKEEDFDRIGEVIKTAMTDTSFQTSHEKIRNECWSTPGESAKNIVDYLVKK